MQGSRRTAHKVQRKRTVRTRVTREHGAGYTSHLQKATNELGKGHSTVYVRYDARTTDRVQRTTDSPNIVEFVSQWHEYLLASKSQTTFE